MFLVKHLCPDLANTTRKLSKANGSANPVAFNDLLHVIKYVIDMKNFGLKIEQKGNFNDPWEIVCFSNSDYAGDPVSRQSIIGFTLYVLGTSLMAIKIPDKCFPFQLRGRVYCLI